MPSTFAFKCSIYVSVARFIRQDVIQRAVPAAAVERVTRKSICGRLKAFESPLLSPSVASLRATR